MPNLNSFLNADVDVGAIDDSLLTQLPKLLRQDHKHALHCILSNVGKYKDQKILFQLRNQANAKPQYNLHGYGHKRRKRLNKRRGLGKQYCSDRTEYYIVNGRNVDLRALSVVL